MLLLTPTLIISCIFIAVLCYLFLNTIDDKKWLSAIIAVLLTPLVYFYIWYPLSTVFLPYHHQKEFNAENWDTKPGLRYEMIDHLITTGFLIDKNHQEIKKILGNPQWLTWDEATKNFNPNKWNYGLGLIPGAFSDTKEDVEITFKNNKVSNVILTQSDYHFKKTNTDFKNKKIDSINTIIK